MQFVCATPLPGWQMITWENNEMPSVQLNITRNVICNTKCVFTTSLILELTWEIVSVALSNNRLRILVHLQVLWKPGTRPACTTLLSWAWCWIARLEEHGSSGSFDPTPLRSSLPGAAGRSRVVTNCPVWRNGMFGRVVRTKQKSISNKKNEVFMLTNCTQPLPKYIY